jgi:hypothetical protein
MASSRGAIRNISYFATCSMKCLHPKPVQSPTRLFDREIGALRGSIREHHRSIRAIKMAQFLGAFDPRLTLPFLRVSQKAR